MTDLVNFAHERFSRPNYDVPGIADDGYTYDYCLAFRTKEKNVTNLDSQRRFLHTLLPGTKKILQKLAQYNLKMKPVWSQDGNTLFVKIHTPLSVLEAVADITDFRLQVDPQKARELAEAGVLDKSHSDGYKVHPIKLNESKSLCRYEPYSSFFAPYDREERHRNIFLNKVIMPEFDVAHPFNSAVRLKILHMLLYRPRFCGLDLDKLALTDTKDDKEDGLISHFAMHNPRRIHTLEQQWITWWKWPTSKEPFSHVKDYFGEQITLYFCFLHHYYKWLTIPAFFGMATQIDVGIEVDTQAYLVPTFIVGLSMWCVVMLEFWKRRQVEIAVLWGMNNFEEEEGNRPSFRGEKIKSPIDGSEILYYPRFKSYSRLGYSYSVVSFLVMCVIAVVAGIFVLRYFMLVSQDNLLETAAPYVGSFLNAVMIQVMNYLYGKIATGLTDLENHRTDTDFVDALTGKLFAFQFINSYSSFYYIAFIQINVQGSCGEGITCMDALAINTAIIFVVALFVGNAQEVLLPLFLSQRRLTKRLDELIENEHEHMPMVEFQSLLEPYDSLTGSMEDYLELAVQYGYVVLFAAAFPAAPFMAFVSNYFEYRFDALKLLKVFRRPMPRGAEDIGAWQTIFEILTVLSVVTNAGLMCFAFDTVWDIDWTPEGRVWTFVIFQYLVLGFQFAVAKIIPDAGPHVLIQLARQEFFMKKIILQEQDEDEELGNLKVEMKEIDEMIGTAIAKVDETDDEPIHIDIIRSLLPLGDKKRKAMSRRERGLLSRDGDYDPESGEPGEAKSESPIHRMDESRL